MLRKMASAVLLLFVCGICFGNTVGGFESKLDLTPPVDPLLEDAILSDPSFAQRKNENGSSAANTSTVPPVNSHFSSSDNTFSATETTVLRKTENASLEDGLVTKSKILKAITTDSEWVPTETNDTNKITQENISPSPADLKASTLVPPDVKTSPVGLLNNTISVSVNTTLSVLKTNPSTTQVKYSTKSKVNPSTIDVAKSSIASTPSTNFPPPKHSEVTPASPETSSKIADISDATALSTEEQRGSPSAETSSIANNFSSSLPSTVTLSSSTPEETKDSSKSSKSNELTTAGKTEPTPTPKDNTSTTSEELKSSTEKPGSTSGVSKDTTVSISDRSTPEETTDSTKSSKSDELTTAGKTGTSVPKDNTSATTSEELKSSTEKPGSTSEGPKDISVSVSDKSTSSVRKSSTIRVETTTHYTNPPTSEGVTNLITTTGGVPKHIPEIYNPTVTTVKLALSITFLVVAIVAMAVLIAYMVKVRKRTIPYEELSLEP